jgi:hypothetical protein
MFSRLGDFVENARATHDIWRRFGARDRKTAAPAPALFVLPMTSSRALI